MTACKGTTFVKFEKVWITGDWLVMSQGGNSYLTTYNDHLPLWKNPTRSLFCVSWSVKSGPGPSLLLAHDVPDFFQSVHPRMQSKKELSWFAVNRRGKNNQTPGCVGMHAAGTTKKGLESKDSRPRHVARRAQRMSGGGQETFQATVGGLPLASSACCWAITSAWCTAPWTTCCSSGLRSLVSVS